MACNPYKNQDFHSIKLQHDSRDLFEDPEFPATNQSLFRFKGPSGVNPQSKFLLL